MILEMTAKGKDALVRILPGCGGTMGTMWHLAQMIQDSESMNLEEILGKSLYHPDSLALLELSETCQRLNANKIDLESVITHFSSYNHLHKFDTVTTIVAAELPVKDRPIAHTLLPLTLVNGNYYYANGNISIPIKGLIQFGPTKGTPYAHLASLIWLEDNGFSEQVLAEQAQNGVLTRAKEVLSLDYHETPRLRRATREAKEKL